MDLTSLHTLSLAVIGKLNSKSAVGTAKDSNRGRVIHLHIDSSLDLGGQTAGSNAALSGAQTQSEGYVLVVDAARRRVDVTGKTSSGVFYGLQSLLGLLAASADQRTLAAVSHSF